MPQTLIAAINPARLSAYESEWARLAGIPTGQVTRPAVAALYVWQVSLSSAWYETLAYAEAIIRNSVDLSLRNWNTSQGRSTDWLNDPAVPLKSLVKKSAVTASDRAQQAAKRRGPTHPRYGEPISFDDRISQLDFGNICFLFPQDPPSQRGQQSTNFNGRENLWIHGLRSAFPRITPELTKSWQGQFPASVPSAVADGYAVGHALERLRRLRNRIGHHEQTFQVHHSRRLKDVSLLLRCVGHGPADSVKKLDRVRRTLAMMPQP